MAKYRKKPRVVEAVRWNESVVAFELVVSWAGDKYAFKMSGEGLLIRTLEGDMLAGPGDWIIKGVKGELYPCKPDIFAETYEPVEE